VIFTGLKSQTFLRTDYPKPTPPACQKNQNSELDLEMGKLSEIQHLTQNKNSHPVGWLSL
jgi:hypothetical protein